MTTRPTNPTVGEVWRDPANRPFECVGVSPNRWIPRLPKFFDHTHTSPPLYAIQNDMWRNPATGSLEVYNGDAWEPTSNSTSFYLESESEPQDVPLGFLWREIPTGIERRLTSGGWFQT